MEVVTAMLGKMTTHNHPEDFIVYQLIVQFLCLLSYPVF